MRKRFNYSIASRVKPSRRGFTLTEIVTAMALSTVAGIAAMTVFVMVSRFAAQGFTESRLLTSASLALERVTRTLNHAYRADAITAANRFTIAEDNESIQFTIPEGNGTTRMQLRFDEGDNALFLEENVGGAFQSVQDGAILENVEEFYVENQEGILSIVLHLRRDMGRNGDKRFTMVGRALPRNL